MKLKLPKKVSDYFSAFKAKYNPEPINSWDDKNTFFGKVWWINPKDIIWPYATNNEENYEGSQTQFGIKKDGTIVWGFFSHCSCFGYENYEGKYVTFEDKEETYKQYELENVDRHIVSILKKRIREMAKRGLKD